MVRLLRSLAFRFRKLFYCINCIGIEHYFGNLKKAPTDFEIASRAVPLLTKGSISISDLQGFIDPDNLFILFYHAEYLIPLITGVFDNLALLTKERYEIIQDIIRVSLSNEEFLKKVDTFNVDVKKHVDQYRDFINLIYEFRDRVIHGEGLSQLVSPVVINWSSFIKITPEINYYIKRCGDDKSEYRFISKWGVFERELDLILDPYFFSKQVLYTIIKFANEYLQKLN
jgi:hypothetical protein